MLQITNMTFTKVVGVPGVKDGKCRLKGFSRGAKGGFVADVGPCSFRDFSYSLGSFLSLW